MTKKEWAQVAGRFTIAEITKEYTAIGCIGSLRAEDLTQGQIDHIKGFYNRSGHPHEIWKEYPVKLNHRFYNDFLIIRHK